MVARPATASSGRVARQTRAARAVVGKYSGNARLKRNDARSLRATSDERLAAKDYDGAMDARLQILKYDKPKVGNLGALTFYATQQLALRDIEKIASHLDAPTLRRYAAQLEKQDARLFTLSQVLINQKADELKLLDGISKTPRDWQKAVNELGFSSQQKSVLQKTTAAQVKSNITSFYDQLIQSAAKPYATSAKKPALDPYSANIATPYAANRFLWAKAKTQRLLLIAALRARADRLEKRTADVPLPPDPFGTGSLQQKNGVIYSIGPDTNDDGGKSVPASNRVQPTAKGDILAPAL